MTVSKTRITKYLAFSCKDYLIQMIIEFMRAVNNSNNIYLKVCFKNVKEMPSTKNTSLEKYISFVYTSLYRVVLRGYIQNIFVEESVYTYCVTWSLLSIAIANTYRYIEPIVDSPDSIRRRCIQKISGFNSK